MCVCLFQLCKLDQLYHFSRFNMLVLIYDIFSDSDLLHSVKQSLGPSSSVQFSRLVVSNSLRPHGVEYARPPCPSLSPGVYPNSCPLSQLCHPTISSSVAPSPPAFNLSQHQGLFKWVSSSHQVAKTLEFQLQHQSFQWTPQMISFRKDWLDSQESSPTPQFKSINSSPLSFLYSSTLTSIHDHWKNHSLD